MSLATASRKAAADHAALALLSDAAQAFVALLAPATNWLRQNPTDGMTMIRVRDSLHGVAVSVGAIRKLVAAETVSLAEAVLEEFCRDLEEGAISLDSSEDVYNVVRPLVWTKARSAYRDFIAGDDAAFEIAHAELRTAIARGAS